MITKTGLYLHAVAVLSPKGAILLLGRSGAGKSTLSALVSKYFPVLVDDWVFAFSDKNSCWMIMDGKRFSVINKVDRNGLPARFRQDGIAYPLHSLIRVFADEKTAIQPLSSMTTCEYLLNAVFELPIQSLETNLSIRNQWFHAVADIARKYQGWQLHFSLNAEHAVTAIQKAD